MTKAPAIRAFLLATLLLGAGQQIFVVTRNPLLSELGWETASIPRVQAVGALAGVASGVVATWTAPRLRLHAAFAICAAIQTIGFAAQTLSIMPWSFFVGAAVAGFAIQLNTALAPPALKTLTNDQNRLSTFALHAIALSPAAGTIAAIAIHTVTTTAGARLLGHRIALGVGALTSAVAAVVFLRAGGSNVPTRPRARVVRPRRVALCIAYQSLVGLAAGITVPFLQLYFKVTFGVTLQEIAYLYAGTMIAGTVAYWMVPRLADRFGLAQTIVVLQLATLPFFFELARATSVLGAAIAFVSRYTLMAATTPMLNAFFQEVSFERDGEVVAGLGMVTSSVTWGFGMWLAGPLLASRGGRFDHAVAATALLYAMIAASAWWILPSLWRSRPLPKSVTS